MQKHLSKHFFLNQPVYMNHPTKTIHEIECNLNRLKNNNCVVELCNTTLLYATDEEHVKVSHKPLSYCH